MSISGRAPRLLFIDSGLGGLTVLRAARASVPEADALFIAQRYRLSYGLKSDAVLVSRLLVLIAPAVRDFSPDCIVLACNTASTIALQGFTRKFHRSNCRYRACGKARCGTDPFRPRLGSGNARHRGPRIHAR